MKKILLSLIFLSAIVQIFAQPLKPNVRQAQLNFPKSFIAWETLKPTVAYNPVATKAKSDKVNKSASATKSNGGNKSASGLKTGRPQTKADANNNLASLDTTKKFSANNNLAPLDTTMKFSANSKSTPIDTAKYLAILYGNCMPNISLDRPINITIINRVSVMLPKDDTDTKPKLTPEQIKGYKADIAWGWVDIGTGVIIQGIAVWTFVKCYEPIKNTNSISIKNSKLNLEQSRSSNAENVKLGLVTGGMAIVGLGLEIAGGIKIHRANIGLGRITYNF